MSVSFEFIVNPTPEQVERLCASSEHNAVNWIMSLWLRPRWG